MIRRALPLVFVVAACSAEPPQLIVPTESPRTEPAPPADGASSASAVAVTPPPAADPPLVARYRATAERITTAATADHAAYDKLAFLTDRIGHRLSGSPSLERATAWAEKVMREDGHENVRQEKVMVPRWVRGSESAEMTAPERVPLTILGLGGTVATPPAGVEGEVVVARTFEELEKLGATVKDKIVLYDVGLPAYDEEKGSGYGDVVKFRSSGPSRAAKLGAKAVLVRSVTARSLKTPHTGATRYEDGVPKIPAAAVTAEDATHLARLVAKNEKVRVRLKLSGKFLADAPSANVIAELRGKEVPDEIVVIGGHIDSWDVGQGAHDDGAGCVMMMQALTVLRKLGLTPRRTIRVVLFTNEENGLKGALAYAEAHKAEIGKHVAAIEADIGGFAPRGFHVEAPKDREAAAVEDVAALMRLVEPLGAKRVKAGFSGADLIPLVKGGVTGLGLLTDARSYFDIHHTAADTLDKVDPDDLAKNVAVMATMAYVLADMPGRLGDRP